MTQKGDNLPNSKKSNTEMEELNQINQRTDDARSFRSYNQEGAAYSSIRLPDGLTTKLSSVAQYGPKGLNFIVITDDKAFVYVLDKENNRIRYSGHPPFNYNFKKSSFDVQTSQYVRSEAALVIPFQINTQKFLVISFDPLDQTRVIDVCEMKWEDVPHQMKFESFLTNFELVNRTRDQFFSFFTKLVGGHAGSIMSLHTFRTPIDGALGARIQRPTGLKIQKKFDFEFLARFLYKKDCNDLKHHFGRTTLYRSKIELVAAHPIKISKRKNLVNFIFYDKLNVIYFFLLDFTNMRILKASSVSLKDIWTMMPITKNFHSTTMAKPLYCKETSTLFCFVVICLIHRNCLKIRFSVTNPFFKKSVSLIEIQPDGTYGFKEQFDFMVDQNPGILNKNPHHSFEEVLDRNFLVAKFVGAQSCLLDRWRSRSTEWRDFAPKLEAPYFEYRKIFKVDENLAVLVSTGELYLLDLVEDKFLDSCCFRVGSLDQSDLNCWKVLGKRILNVEVNGRLSVYDFSDENEVKLLRIFELETLLSGDIDVGESSMAELGVLRLKCCNFLEWNDFEQRSPILLFSYETTVDSELKFDCWIKITFENEDYLRVMESKTFKVPKSNNKNSELLSVLDHKNYIRNHWIVKSKGKNQIIVLNQDLEATQTHQIKGFQKTDNCELTTQQSGLIYLINRTRKKVKVFDLSKGSKITQIEGQPKRAYKTGNKLSLIRDVTLKTYFDLNLLKFDGFHVIQASDNPMRVIRVREPLGLVKTKIIEITQESSYAGVEVIGLSKSRCIVQFRRNLVGVGQADKGALQAWLVDLESEEKREIETFGLSSIIAVETEGVGGVKGGGELHTVYLAGDSIDHFMKVKVSISE